MAMAGAAPSKKSVRYERDEAKGGGEATQGLVMVGIGLVIAVLLLIILYVAYAALKGGVAAPAAAPAPPAQTAEGFFAGVPNPPGAVARAPAPAAPLPAPAAEPRAASAVASRPDAPKGPGYIYRDTLRSTFTD